MPMTDHVKIFFIENNLVIYIETTFFFQNDPIIENIFLEITFLFNIDLFSKRKFGKISNGNLHLITYPVNDSSNI